MTDLTEQQHRELKEIILANALEGRPTFEGTAPLIGEQAATEWQWLSDYASEMTDSYCRQSQAMASALAEDKNAMDALSDRRGA